MPLDTALISVKYRVDISFDACGDRFESLEVVVVELLSSYLSVKCSVAFVQ
jgi:hypothetical protein